MTKGVRLEHSTMESLRGPCRTGSPGHRENRMPMDSGACMEYLICAWHGDRLYEGRVVTG